MDRLLLTISHDKKFPRVLRLICLFTRERRKQEKKQEGQRNKKENNEVCLVFRSADFSVFDWRRLECVVENQEQDMEVAS